MSIERQTVGKHEQGGKLEDVVRNVVIQSGQAVSARGVSQKLAAPREVIREHLESLTAAGELQETTAPDGTARWLQAGGSVELRAEANSYQITDTATGIVSRGGTRGQALHRMADRLEEYAEGDRLGAQIRGISESELSPSYAKSIEDLLESYVEPEDKHLYVYVEDGGVRELETAGDLNRDQTVLAYAVTGQFTYDEYDDSLQIPLVDLVSQTPLVEEHFPLSQVKVMAVHPDHHGRGIGSALTAHVMTELAENPPVVTMLWERENEANQKIAESLGAQRLATFDRTSPSRHQCPECGFDRECTCRSVFYGWGFE